MLLIYWRWEITVKMMDEGWGGGRVVRAAELLNVDLLCVVGHLCLYSPVFRPKQWPSWFIKMCLLTVIKSSTRSRPLLGLGVWIRQRVPTTLRELTDLRPGHVKLTTRSPDAPPCRLSSANAVIYSPNCPPGVDRTSRQGSGGNKRDLVGYRPCFACKPWAPLGSETLGC